MFTYLPPPYPFPHLHTPSPLLPVPNKPDGFCKHRVYLLTTSIPPSPFSPSLISLMVSEDTRHHVYLVTVPSLMPDVAQTVVEVPDACACRRDSAECRARQLHTGRGQFGQTGEKTRARREEGRRCILFCPPPPSRPFPSFPASLVSIVSSCLAFTDRSPFDTKPESGTSPDRHVMSVCHPEPTHSWFSLG